MPVVTEEHVLAAQVTMCMGACKSASVRGTTRDRPPFGVSVMHSCPLPSRRLRSHTASCTWS
ncbi:MAG: hypothetical protein WBY94_08545 [Polyangiaceae bacterium]